MKSLPTLLSTKELDALISEFPQDKVAVHRSSSVITVTTLKGKKILSAISNDGRMWAVRAPEGLIVAK